jgi:hypothetical protein
MVGVAFDSKSDNQGSEVSFHGVSKKEMEKFSRLLGIEMKPLYGNDPHGTQFFSFEICGVEITLFSEKEYL